MFGFYCAKQNCGNFRILTTTLEHCGIYVSPIFNLFSFLPSETMYLRVLSMRHRGYRHHYETANREQENSLNTYTSFYLFYVGNEESNVQKTHRNGFPSAVAIDVNFLDWFHYHFGFLILKLYKPFVTERRNRRGSFSQGWQSWLNCYFRY